MLQYCITITLQGDTAIKYFEIIADPPGVFFLSMYQSKDVKRGAAAMPKRLLDHMQCEVMRFYTLQTKGLIEPISMTVPRKVCTWNWLCFLLKLLLCTPSTWFVSVWHVPRGHFPTLSCWCSRPDS